MCVVVLSPDGRLRYCCAGHPAPVIRRAHGGVDVLDGGRSPLLGAGGHGAHRTAGTAHLGEGDVLVAFSDGAFESRTRGYDDGYRDLLDRFRDDVVVLATRRAASPVDPV
jgi:serine phosphatase RsbU (regulator of sigma subunit)